MSYGYSLRLMEANKQADTSHLGVYLGRKCIKHNIPVVEVSSLFGVSRMTIYNWFVGTHDPQAKHRLAIKDYLKSFK